MCAEPERTSAQVEEVVTALVSKVEEGQVGRREVGVAPLSPGLSEGFPGGCWKPHSQEVGSVGNQACLVPKPVPAEVPMEQHGRTLEDWVPSSSLTAYMSLSHTLSEPFPHL